MITLGHPIGELLWALALALSAVVAALAAFILVRRVLHSAHSNSVRDALASCIQALLNGAIEYEVGINKLREHPETASQILLQCLRLADTDTSRQFPGSVYHFSLTLAQPRSILRDL
jgi:hypothetical protein